MFRFKLKSLGFTLVELIVVITILAILGTIGFLAFQGYNKKSRDSVRTSDLGSIKTSLELFRTKTGLYPEVTNPKSITYSGALVWKQGTFGESTYKQLGDINKIPLDPLSDVEYSYSLTNNKGEYEIALVYEGGLAQNTQNKDIFKKSYAENKIPGTTKIIGTYNGGLFHLISVQTGGINNVLFLPTIMAGKLDILNLEEIIGNNEMVISGVSKLPSSYRDSSFSDKELELNLGENNGGNLVVLTGGLSELKSDTASGVELRKTFIGNIQNILGGSMLENSYSELMSIDPGISNADNNDFIDTSGSDYLYLTDNNVLKTYDPIKAITNILNSSIVTEGANPSMYIGLSGFNAPSDLGIGDPSKPIILKPIILPDPILTQTCEASLTQLEADELNVLTNKNRTISSWCSTKTITIMNKNLTSVPTGVPKLLNLIKLNLRLNQITSLPASIGDLTKLEQIYLGDNHLTTLPTEIGNLVNLKYLGLYGNNLISLPASIGNLVNLNGFLLGKNQLTSLPTEIGNLVNLKKLGVYDNLLTSLPTSIGNLTKLEFLTLWGNEISILPTSIGNLTNLNTLGMWGNLITSLPLELGNLTKLTLLNLGNNLSIGNLSSNYRTGIYNTKKDTKGVGNQCIEITSPKSGKITINTSADCTGVDTTLIEPSCSTPPNTGTMANLGTTTTGTPTSPNQAWIYSSTPGNCTYTCIDGYSGTNCSTSQVTNYPGCDTADITLLNGQIWSSCNLGSTISGTGSNSYGKYFQWGRNKGFENSDITQQTSQITFNPNTNDTLPYIAYPVYPYDWITPKNDDLWGSVSNTNIARQGPCSIGYHVPTQSEWQSACNSISGTSCSNDSTTASALRNTLKLPISGHRSNTDGVNKPGVGGYYWTSDPTSTDYAYNFYLSTSSVYPSDSYKRARGMAIRCISNSIAEPSCATSPNTGTMANLGTTTTGTPTSPNQAWTYSATPGNCTYTCTDGYYGDNCSILLPAVSSNIINFETDGEGTLYTTTQGTFIRTTVEKNEGLYSIESGNQTNSSSSCFEVTRTETTYFDVIFDSKTSSELDYDYLKFYVNGVEKYRLSGDSIWNTHNETYGSGTYTFKWCYEKDEATSSGQDKVWVDNIRFIESTNSCATPPDTGTMANLGEITIGSPTSANQTWIYSSTPGNCTYTCINGYGGDNCSILLSAVSSNIIDFEIDLEGSLYTTIQGIFTRTTVEKNEGLYSIESGNHTDSSSSCFEVTRTETTYFDVIFDSKTLSELNYDYLKFYVNGVWDYRWSGDNIWSTFNKTFGPGTYTFKWCYEKDSSTSSGQDKVWVDNIRFIESTNSCATQPDTGTMANLGEITIGSPTSANQNWTYSSTPGACTYTCVTGYTGTDCATALTDAINFEIDGQGTLYNIINGTFLRTTVEKNEGLYSIESGNHSNSSSSCFQVVKTKTTSFDIVFDRKVSSESGYDYLKFYSNGVWQYRWSGNFTWLTQTQRYGPGTYTFKWCYEKDSSVSSGQDKAWVDNIRFVEIANSCATPPNTGTIANLGTTTTGTPTSQNQAWNYSETPGNCTYTCVNGFSGADCSTPLVSECTTGMTELTLSNGQTWSCLNLGATTVWDGSTQPIDCGGVSTTNCNAGNTWLGDYYQWGRDEPVNTTTTVATYNGAFSGLLGHNNFVLGESSYGDWWQDEAGSSTPTRWTGTNPQGPCPSGWHVPSPGEWQTACNTISGTSCANNSTTVNSIISALKLPFAGNRWRSNGYYYGQSANGFYSSMSPYSNLAYNLRFGASDINIIFIYARANGLSVRCLKN